MLLLSSLRSGSRRRASLLLLAAVLLGVIRVGAGLPGKLTKTLSTRYTEATPDKLISLDSVSSFSGITGLSVSPSGIFNAK